MKQQAGWPALVFLAPALVVYTAFSAWPLLATLRLGLYGTDDVGHVRFVGVPLMLIYAALIAIPEEVVEAAQVEGAGAWRIFWRIRLPLILPTLGLVNILTFVGNFNAFDLVYAVKGALAGPNFSTDLLG